MSSSLNVSRSTPKHILIIVANPSHVTTTGWPVGLWASELTHPYYEFTEAGYEVTIASPQGGKVALDGSSDPRDPSGYSSHDLISMGFLHIPKLEALLDHTKPLGELRVGDFDAVVVAGGQSPMFTFPNEKRLHQRLAEFYQAEKVTAALCHGVCSLLGVKLSSGEPLIKGKTITGFSNAEEDTVDQMVGQKFMPFRIEDEAKKLGANFISAGVFRSFAIRDGRLVTGQQQNSGSATAKLIIEVLGIEPLFPPRSMT